MELSALYQIFLECNTVTTDSRNCPKGSMFIALKGDSFNGNAFATQAINDGCAYAIVDEAAHVVKGDKRYILVDSCIETLQQLANYHRRQLGTRIIGITGTNGKTTTKELISAVLSQSYNVLYTQGNLNNHIGAVSYTHLDVYKRQVNSWRNSHLSGIIGINKISFQHSIFKNRTSLRCYAFTIKIAGARCLLQMRFVY